MTKQQYIDCLDKIVHLGKLAEGWDGYGGFPVSDVSKVNASAILAIIGYDNDTPDPFISPVPDGSLEIEYETIDKFATISVWADGRISVLYGLESDASDVWSEIDDITWLDIHPIIVAIDFLVFGE